MGRCDRSQADDAAGIARSTRLVLTDSSSDAMAARYAVAARLLESGIAAGMVNNRIVHHWTDDGLWYETNDRDGPRYMAVTAATGHRRQLDRPPAQLPTGPSATLPSPDGRRSLFARDHDLWLAEGGAERRLTYDGEAYFAYGKLFDDSTQTVAARRTKVARAPSDCAWSPDSRIVVGHRNDERTVEPYPFVESVPLDGSHRPKLHEVRLSLLGEAGQLARHAYLIDIARGNVRSIATPPGWALDSAPVGWTTACDRVFLTGTTEDRHGAGLFEVDTAGNVRAVVVEPCQASSAAFFLNAFEYRRANVRVIDDGRQAIWFSQADGQARLILIDVASSAPVRVLTPGSGVVLDLIAVSESRRLAFATIAGGDAGRDPYQRDLYAIPLDDGPPRRLTTADADHAIAAPLAPFWAQIIGAPAGADAVSPDGASFVDVASTVDRATVTSLRATADGACIAELERADAKVALRSGWRPPIRFSALAADGLTELWGALYLPPDYDASRRYPLIDALYGGPQLTVAPRNFDEGGPAAAIVGRAALAALGFIVVTVDGRGTPGRDRTFWEAGYGNFADVAIDDHVAVIGQLAARYPGIDATRVGVQGHSFGGYVATRAMLRYPDVYKVGVASAAVQNWQGFRDAYRQYLGPVDYVGSPTMPHPAAIPVRYRPLDNGELADRLLGRLLLAYSDLDENALPSSTLQFIDALTRANRRYDLVYLPNRRHGFVTDPYFIQRTWDYFVEHLRGERPPADYRLEVAAWTR